MKTVLDPEDYAEIRDMTMGNIDFVPTDEEIDTVVQADPYSAATAKAWGWNDTEVRERLCAALERLRAAAGEE